jgi:hypothetical protein
VRQQKYQSAAGALSWSSRGVVMNFVHCADVHLDSPMRGLARYEGLRLSGSGERLAARSSGLWNSLLRNRPPSSSSPAISLGRHYTDSPLTIPLDSQRLRDLTKKLPVAIASESHEAVLPRH